MQNLRKKQSGFTLIELLIVIIIVAILVAVGVPLLQGNVRRAKLTEADAGLGTIRTHMRARLAERGSYILPAVPTLAGIGIRLRVAGPPIVPGDLDGRFFSEETYGFAAAPPVTATTYCSFVDGTLSTNAAGQGTVRFNEVNGAAGTPTNFQRSMDQDGTIYNNTIVCAAGVGNANIVN